MIPSCNIPVIYQKHRNLAKAHGTDFSLIHREMLLWGKHKGSPSPDKVGEKVSKAGKPPCLKNAEEERNMVMTRGFDNQKYIKMQSQHIQDRIAQFGGKLYLEFGGKLFDDYHAARVLPGFQPDSKIRMLAQMKAQAEVVIVINATDIEKNKLRADLGITYDSDVLRLIDSFRAMDLYVGSVVVTRYANQPSADAFLARLEHLGVKTYKHYSIAGYPHDISHIVSEEGYGKNQYVETTKPLVVMTAPGPGSGKFSTCLSQLYHDFHRGITSGYAKFETFPIWNLDLKHPVNLAYEAATADLDDVNMLDPFHLEAYGEATVNYNRDIEIFPVLQAIFEKIMGKCPYQSPTDMGVNMAGNCILNQEAVMEAAKQEILVRYYEALCQQRQQGDQEKAIFKLELLMKQADVTTQERSSVAAALDKERSTQLPAMAITLGDGSVIRGKTSDLMGCSASALLNALKVTANIAKETMLIQQSAISPIQEVKTKYLGSCNPRLHSDEILIALASSASTDPFAQQALEALALLKGAQAHCSVMVSPPDARTYKRLGIRLTCEPQYESNNLFHH